MLLLARLLARLGVEWDRRRGYRCARIRIAGAVNVAIRMSKALHHDLAERFVTMCYPTSGSHRISFGKLQRHRLSVVTLFDGAMFTIDDGSTASCLNRQRLGPAVLTLKLRTAFDQNGRSSSGKPSFSSYWARLRRSRSS